MISLHDLRLRPQPIYLLFILRFFSFSFSTVHNSIDVDISRNLLMLLLSSSHRLPLRKFLDRFEVLPTT